ncbi:MAG: amino acid transporter [Chloroflexota bacterium]|nr:amino acid transporter [Chloroflexota bacterium]
MTTTDVARWPHAGRLKRWLLDGHVREAEGPYERERQQQQQHHQHPWWQVMCLTGVDYFSTLGYQPGIAALAAGALSPIATLILVLITLFGALPMYKRVAAESPHGDGSISMLENLLKWWQGKLFVLLLIGFVATGFVITITLSAADATAHVVENPFTHFLEGYEVPITLLLIGLLGAVFLKGFTEAIGIAVFLVATYILLNIVVIGMGIYQVLRNPQVLSGWQEALFSAHGNPVMMLVAAVLVFPRLALGLSGFETGVVVMPLVRGDSSDTPDHPRGRIRNTRKLLTSAALIMSVLLLASSLVTTLLIPHEEFLPGTATRPAGEAYGRALAYLAHEHLGDLFGTVYDISTIFILWFAGASAMAGLLNIVPRYLPRYGMAPNWARATRPLVLIFTLICFTVTILFRADVDAQAGAYATGVLALITSATIAVTLSARRKRQRRAALGFGLVSLIFIYTTAVTVIQEPEGIQIAGIFITAIIVSSLISRVWRSTELRATEVVLDEIAERFIDEAARQGEIRLIANHPDERNSREYLLKEREERESSHIPSGDPVLFLEVTVRDASEFAPVLQVRGEEIGGHRVLRAESAAVPNAIAAFLIYLRDRTGKRPHIYFGWSEGNPLKYLVRYILFGEGDIAPVTHEVLRQAEPDPRRRPAIHVG